MSEKQKLNGPRSDNWFYPPGGRRNAAVMPPLCRRLTAVSPQVALSFSIHPQSFFYFYN
jgi:hypothetical protein